MESDEALARALSQSAAQYENDLLAQALTQSLAEPARPTDNQTTLDSAISSETPSSAVLQTLQPQPVDMDSDNAVVPMEISDDDAVSTDWSSLSRSEEHDENRQFADASAWEMTPYDEEETLRLAIEASQAEQEDAAEANSADDDDMLANALRLSNELASGLQEEQHGATEASTASDREGEMLADALRLSNELAATGATTDHASSTSVSTTENHSVATTNQPATANGVTPEICEEDQLLAEALQTSILMQLQEEEQEAAAQEEAQRRQQQQEAAADRVYVGEPVQRQWPPPRRVRREQTATQQYQHADEEADLERALAASRLDLTQSSPAGTGTGTGTDTSTDTGTGTGTGTGSAAGGSGSGTGSNSGSVPTHADTAPYGAFGWSPHRRQRGQVPPVAGTYFPSGSMGLNAPYAQASFPPLMQAQLEAAGMLLPDGGGGQLGVTTRRQALQRQREEQAAAARAEQEAQERRRQEKEAQDAEFREALERDRRKQEERALAEHQARARQQRRLGTRERLLARRQRMIDAEATLPPEPAPSDGSSAVVTLRVRLPDGAPCQRCFDGEQSTVGDVRRWVDAQLARSCDPESLQSAEDAHSILMHYELVPGGFRALALTDPQQTLHAAQLRGRSVLIVREIDTPSDVEDEDQSDHDGEDGEDHTDERDELQDAAAEVAESESSADPR